MLISSVIWASLVVEVVGAWDSFLGYVGATGFCYCLVSYFLGGYLGFASGFFRRFMITKKSPSLMPSPTTVSVSTAGFPLYTIF